MIQVTNITNDPKQNLIIVGEEGQEINVSLRFIPTQRSWMMGIREGDFNVQGIILGTAPNILNQYRNLLSFGITCRSVDGLDPFRQDDFARGRITLFVLNRQELQIVEEGIFT